MTRRGPGIDPDLSHRRFLDLAPGLRPLQDGTLFDRIGGQATVDRLVDSLYDRFAADAVIRPFFGRDLANGRNRQKRFFWRRSLIPPLMCSPSRRDDPAYVAALLRHGARVDHRYNGATPLHYVVKAGFVQTIQVLLQHGADKGNMHSKDRPSRRSLQMKTALPPLGIFGEHELPALTSWHHFRFHQDRKRES